MRISSRTPEGEPGRCGVCGAASLLSPADPLRDAVCPCCGCLVIVPTVSPPPPWQDPVHGVRNGIRLLLAAIDDEAVPGGQAFAQARLATAQAIRRQIAAAAHAHIGDQGRWSALRLPNGDWIDCPRDMIPLDNALTELARHYPRKR